MRQQTDSGHENRSNAFPRADLPTFLILAATLLVFATAGQAQSFRLETGTYLGDGTDDRAISGLGFQPDVVILRGDQNTTTPFKSSTMIGDATKELGTNNALVADLIQSLDVDGFTIGSDPKANASGVSFYWTAFRTAPGQMAAGTFVGDGNDDRDITGVGFQPDFVLIMNGTGEHSIERFASQPGDASFEVKSSGYKSDRVQALLPDGFQVGSHNSVNEADMDLHWIAWRASSQAAEGTFTGDGNDNRDITGLGFEPGFLFLHVKDVESVHRQGSMAGDLTFRTDGGAAFTDAIQDFLADGFQVGSDDLANRSGKPIHWIALSDQPSADLNATKSVDVGTPNEGATVVYTVVVDNLGPDSATGVAVTDLLPTSVTYVSDTTTQGTYASGTGLWTVGAMGVSAPDTLTITVTVNAGTGGTTIVNAASVTASDQADPTSSNDADSASLTVLVPPVPTLSSQADQYLFVNDTPQFMSAATITDDPGTASISAAQDIRIRIPAGFNMVWSTSDSTATLLGGAASKVSPTVTFEDADRTVVLDVTTDFAPSDQLIVSGLLFTGFTAVSPFNNLELETGNNGVVAAVDDRTITVLAQISTRSSALALTPDGSELWVVNPDHGTVAVIATATNALQAEIPVAGEPWTVAIHPWNSEAWVTSMANHHVYIVDTGSRTVVDSIAAGFETFGVAFNPQGTAALVTATGSDELFAVDVANRTITNTIPVYRRPRGIAFRGEGRRAWVSHLLMPEFFGRLTEVFPATWTTTEIALGQVFDPDLGGYPSAMQNITLAPAPGDSILWIPNDMIHTSNGTLFGNPMTDTNMFHATVRPIDVDARLSLTADTYYLSESGTDVAGPIAVDFRAGNAYVANLHSDDVTVITADLLTATEVAVIDVGKAPIGVLAHPTQNTVYVANWLSRDVSVIDAASNTVVATVPTVGSESLPAMLLHGKQLFFTSRGNMSSNRRAACASCHVLGTHDSRPWDLSQFGKHIRATPDIRGIGFTGAHDWTADKDEMADHHFGIVEFAGGPGLIPTPNPPLGASNAGLSSDMDAIGLWMSSLTHRNVTPYRMPDGSQTASADSGEVLFNDPVVACATCHVPPFFTDSRLQLPFIKHDVGTADSTDADAAAGFDTPSLVGAWDHGPYLHHALALTLQSVMTTFNPNDLHGTTSHLSAAQIDHLAEYINSLAWPDSTGTAVAAPVVGTPAGTSLDNVFPNPFHRNTSLRFLLERNADRVLITVYDVQGRLVRTLLDRPQARGTHVVGWDTRDDAGRPVAPGIYFARYVVDGRPHGDKKMAVLR